MQRRHRLKRALTASALALLTGCTALPESAPRPVAMQPPTLTASQAAAAPAVAPAASAASAPASAPAAQAARKPSRLLALARRLFRRPEVTPTPAAVPAESETPEAPVDDKYRLTGEEALELERGSATWYGAQFHGQRTASGEVYDKYALTAAHKTLPFGTIVRVRSLKLGREVDVRINDRGPFAPGRVIDVSQAAAEALGLTGAGVAEVSLNVTEATLEGAQSQPSAQTGARRTKDRRTKDRSTKDRNAKERSAKGRNAKAHGTQVSGAKAKVTAKGKATAHGVQAHKAPHPAPAKHR